MKAYYTEVAGAISDVLQLEVVPGWPETTRLETDLGMDSGLMLELIMLLEETIPRLLIDPATLSYEQFASIGSVCDFVATSQKQDRVV